MRLLGRVSAIVPAIMVICMSAVLMSHAEIQDMRQKQDEAVEQLRKDTNKLRPTAENIVERASGYAPEPVYQANVRQYPNRRNNSHRFKSDFIALEFRSEQVTTNVLCLRGKRKKYWCQVKPEIEGAQIRQLRSYKKYDLHRLVAVAIYNGAEVREMSAAKAAKHAPELANHLWEVVADNSNGVNVHDLVWLYDAHVYSLGSLPNPLDVFLFKKTLNIQPFLDAKKVRDHSFFGRDEFASLLQQM